MAKKVNAALMKPLDPSAALAEVVGHKPLARSAAIKSV
jgi:chromatin remodeling complex protein RSC6